MCGRISIAVKDELLAEYLQKLGVVSRRRRPWYHPRYNIPPSQDLIIVVQEGGQRHVRPMRWGLIPPWAGELSAYRPQINARAETVRVKPAFRNAFAHHRGVAVVDGFYEWQRYSRVNIPYRIHREDGQPFTLAALWERRGSSDRPLETCAIITAKANKLIAPIHDRIPLVLSDTQRDRWLDPNADVVKLEKMLAQDTMEPLVGTQITSYVNSPAHDDAGCWDAA